MLEGLAAWILKTYIGKFVNVDAEKLSVGLLSGVVELENVHLKSDAFNDNSFPFQLKFGNIGKVKLNISLNTLRYTPWLFELEHIAIIFGPKTQHTSNSDSTTNKENILFSKLKKLESLEQKWFKETEFLGIDTKQDANKQNLSSKMLALLGPMSYSLLNNILISLKSVHIRYEDDLSQFSFGAYIESLLIKNGESQIDPVDGNTESKKICELNDFCIYSDAFNLYQNDQLEKLNELMNFKNLSTNQSQQKLMYIIKPTSFSSELIRNMSSKPLRKRKKPRIRIYTVLNNIEVDLAEKQLNNLFLMFKNVNIYNNKIMCSHLVRPDSKDVKHLWLYTVGCILHLIKKPNLNDFKNWARDVNLYRKIYETILNLRIEQKSIEKTSDKIATNVYNLPEELFIEKQRIEKEWTFKRLLTIRRVIFEKFINTPDYKNYLLTLKNQTEFPSSTNSSGVYGYFSWSLNSIKDYYYGSMPKESSDAPEITKNIEERLAIENTIESKNKVDDEVMGLINDSIENDSLLRRDSVLAYLEFKVDTSIICLHSEANTGIVKFKFEQSNFKLEVLPRYDSFLFQMNLGSFYLIDSTVDSQSFHSILIYPKNRLDRRQLDSNGVVFLAYEYNPLTNFQKTTGLKYKSNLTIKSCGLDIILNVNVIENLKSFFMHTNQYFENSNSVLFKLKTAKSITKDQPIYTKQKINPILNTNFNFEITSPKLIIPQTFKSKNPYVIIFDFGRLILENMQLKKEELILSTSSTEQQITKVILEASEDESEDEEEFHTPNATPPNEIDDTFLLNEKTSDNEFNYNLYLNDLQVLTGKLLTDNLDVYINKGHSIFHLLEKFDIKIKIEMPRNPSEGMRETNYFKFTINMNLLKLNIDDLKIINSYRTIQNLQTLVKMSLNESTQNKHEQKQEIQPVKVNACNNVTLLDINLKLKEFNVALSAISTQDIFLLKRNQLVKTLSNILNEPKSLCELKIFNFNFNLNSKTNNDLDLKLEISNLILIDARQIYGPDYQLLAASHNSIFLDTTTGLIQNSNETQVNEPLIKINLILKNNHVNSRDLILNFSFNTLDLILNPETISEIVIFAYSIYLSLSNYSVNHFDQMDQTLELNFFQNQTLQVESGTKLNTSVYFEFKRLRMLMFHIEDQDMGLARKVALLDLNGVFIEATSVPEDKYLKVTSKLLGFDIIDLKEENEINKSKTIVFTMGFDDEEEQGAFEINYETVKNLEFDFYEESNLTIAISSLCYEHSAIFLDCLQNCLKDFMRFHAKVIEEVTEIATDLAINFLKKGKDFSPDSPSDSFYIPNTIETDSNKQIIIQIILQTPILAIPMNLNSNKFLVAHLGDLKISNSKSNQMKNTLSFKIDLTDMCLFSLDSNSNETILNPSPKSKFKFYFKPKISEKIIYNTDAEINLDYLMEFINNKKLDFNERKFVETKNDLESSLLNKQTCLRVLFSVKNICKIAISKPQLEQINATLDNLIYKPKHSEMLTSFREEDLIFDSSSTFKDESLKPFQLNLEIFFKIKIFEVCFLADVEHANQEIALLKLDRFNFYICKYESSLIYIDISLDDLQLIDKLIKLKTQCEENDYSLKESAKFLFNIPSRSKAAQKGNMFHKSKSKSESNLKQIRAENIFSNFLFKKKLERNFKLFDNLDKSLSISVPDEISTYFSKHDYNDANNASKKNSNKILDNQKKRPPRKKKISININGDASEESDCPQTPPPSPSRNFFRSSYLTKSESNIFEQFSDSSCDNLEVKPHKDSSKTSLINKKDNSNITNKKVLANKINLIVVNEKHPDFFSKFKSVHRHVMVNLSDLHVNVNPETWIFFLDFLGLGSKIYSVETEGEDLNIKEEEKKSFTDTTFEVKDLLININDSLLKNRLATFVVNGVSAFIETKTTFLKCIGKLNKFSLIDDFSPLKTNGNSGEKIFLEKLIAHGKKPIEFEFFKNIGHPEILKTKMFESFLKLKLDTAKYIHIQSFLLSIVNYFQQFLNNMDALGRMKALASGQKGISFNYQRGSRVKLDIEIQEPTLVLPSNSKSKNAIVLKFDTIKVDNKFLQSNQSDISLMNAKNQNKESSNVNQNEERDCLLDCMKIQCSNMFAYSAVHDLNNNDEKIRGFQVKFDSFLFNQFAEYISKQKYSFDLQIERNLENELSHKSPDWNIYTKFTSTTFKLNFEQYKILRSFLDQNLGEPIKPNSSQLNFLIPNPKLETVLSGNVWKAIRIHLDMKNIGIDLVDSNRSIALFKFENSSLIFESYSDTTKLIDLVSNEIAILQSSEFVKPSNIIYKKNNSPDLKRLQLELHSRFYKESDRYSILFNNCAVVVMLDWLIRLKSFFATYVNENDLNNLDKANKKLELKFNLTNTDFFLIEKNLEISSLTQAVILRITAFLEYNQKKPYKPLQSCIQSIQVFSCQTNSVEETALSILDPAIFTINLLSKTNFNINEESNSILQSSTLISNKNSNEFLFDISTDTLQLKISYLDIKLFLKIAERLKAQLDKKENYSWDNFNNKNAIKVEKNEEKWTISDINLVINNFSILIIDDCKDIDIPLFEIIFNRLRVIQNSDKTVGLLSIGKGSSEFALNISYYNRLLSGWEPLLEPWLSRFDWKLKETKKSFTLTSMDVLNINISNPFIDLMLSVFANWKEDYFKNRLSKHQKVFQPYKLMNSSGQTIKFRFFKSDSFSTQGFDSFDLKNQHSSLDPNFEWISIEDKCERSFSFYQKINHCLNRAHKNSSSKLIQNQIRIKIDDWSEIRPLTIDKVGTFYRNIVRIGPAPIAITIPNETRLIFNISLSDNATKLIEIKSPVSIKNNLNYKLQCRIEPRIEYIMNRIGPLIIEIGLKDEISIPIKYLPCNLWFRPLDFDTNYEAEFSLTPINLNEINQPGQIEYYEIICKLASNLTEIKSILASASLLTDSNQLFNFFAKIKCYNFLKRMNNSTDLVGLDCKNLPGHMIILEPSFTLFNLLPLEFRYKFIGRNTNLDKSMKSLKFEQVINGKINSNNHKSFYNINVSKQNDFLLDIDNYRMTKPIEINPHKHLTNFYRNQTNTPSNESEIVSTVDKNETRRNSKSRLNSSSSNSTNNNTSISSLSNRKLTVLRRINFHDEKNRPLFLIARIIFKIGSGLISNNMEQDIDYFQPCPILIQISSIYCFFNLTGLPLIFRQFNCDEAAGQLEEHEMACNSQPLLFSFNEIDSPYACSMRIGKLFKDFHQHSYYKSKSNFSVEENVQPKWCKPFGLDSGSSFRGLKVSNNLSTSYNDTGLESFENSDKDWVYYVGIEIKPGTGMLKDTTFVYFSTRYYLVNKSDRNLMIAQNLFIQNLKEKNCDLTFNSKKLKKQESLNSNKTSNIELKQSIVLLKDSMIQFNWPRADFDQSLSVRLQDESQYNWSGAFKIDQVNSFYLSLKNLIKDSEFFFLKVNIFLDNGTFYVVFTEKIDFPFPIRIENNSEVTIYISQNLNHEEKHLINVNPSCKLHYTWEEPLAGKKILVGVKGGTSQVFDFNLQENKKHLYYENFFYIVFNNNSNEQNNSNNFVTKLNDFELVLTVKGNKICLDKKESGNRSQLWHMTTDGLLIHEGSSPPRELEKTHLMLDLENRFVLDIEDCAPRPNYLIPLVLRLPDSRRKNTQSWTFDKDGFMRCKVLNMSVQLKGEFQRNTPVVLGPNNLNSENIPSPLIKVSRFSLKPGSGHLVVKVEQDGPTKVINISNIKDKSYLSINWEKNKTTENEIKLNNIAIQHKSEVSYEFYVNLTGGMGFSIIQWLNQEYEELLYAYLKLFEINFDQTQNEQKLLLKIQSIQVCNQILNSQRQNLLLIPIPQQSSLSDETNLLNAKPKEALKIDFCRHFKDNENIFTIEHLLIDLADINLQIEEKLLWKLIQFSGINYLQEPPTELSQIEEKFKDLTTDELSDVRKNEIRSLGIIANSDSSDSIAKCYYKTQINTLIKNSQATKYSFNKFQINNINMVLSVYKASKLSNDLQKIKTSLSIPLIQFENARIECKTFILMNEYDTALCIINLIKKHYTQELRSHAIRILGSVDFLGNPLGLMVDFKESLTNVLTNGEVTDFVFSVTHGVANSVSKFSNSLSEELNELTMDERHRETREQIRNIYNNGSIDHFVGGALGFAVGIVGGAFSLATSTYRGFNENGVTGAFTGLGKGAVGTVSKPIVGMLDFATGIASAIRETSKTIYKMEIPRVRETRCCASTPGALLSPFSRTDSNGQKILYQINNYNLNEKFVALEQLNYSESILSLVTNQRVLFIKTSEFEFKTLYEVNYQEIRGTTIFEEGGKFYLEITIENEGMNKSPRFKFESKDSANSLENKIQYAKINYDEAFYSFSNNTDDEV